MNNLQQSAAGRLNQKIFDGLYSRSLVYNTCWEDPAVDRRALNLTPDDSVRVITSAGCNALDYALTGVQRVHAVDANPRQSALLELKLAGVHRLEYEDFFRFFGEGRHDNAQKIYRSALRAGRRRPTPCSPQQAVRVRWPSTIFRRMTRGAATTVPFSSPAMINRTWPR